MPTPEEIEKMNVQEYVLFVDFMTTREFCDWQKLPHPKPLPDPIAAADQFVTLDLIKLRLIKEKAKSEAKKTSIQSNKMKEAIQITLIAVKNQDITVFPASEKTPDYIQLLENSIK